MKTYKKYFYLFAVIALVVGIVTYLFPLATKFLIAIRTHAYTYSYTPPEDLVAEDVSDLAPAQGVPILMYHGIIAGRGILGTNTTRENFVAQMEMLKRNGYQTISIADYDAFREGKFILPPKPVIITFDDGRRDSFYASDEVFKKLGFKATIFPVTARMLSNDPFFLSWSELKYMRDSGRWEIEAHGRNSHDKFVNDAKGDIGVYLTSRLYSPTTDLESVANFEQRVSLDYLNNLHDLKNYLGIDAQYFAVPLNHYGDDDQSNYPDAGAFNRKVVSETFRLAFIEAGDKDNKALDTFYNYKDTDKTDIKRLEVKNMTASDLETALDQFAPTKPNLSYPNPADAMQVKNKTELLYGNLDTTNGISLISSPAIPSARVLIGDEEWKNYDIEMSVTREEGQSTSILAYYKNEDNLIALDWGNKYASLIERVNGKERTIASYDMPKPVSRADISIRIWRGVVSAAFNGVTVTNGAPTTLTRGTSGLSVWDAKEAHATIHSFTISSLDAEPKALQPVPIASVAAGDSSNELEAQGYYDDPTMPYVSTGMKKYDWTTVANRFSILDNSTPWNDYSVTAGVWLGRSDFTLMTRYQDADNYTACTFTDHGKDVTMFKVVAGTKEILAENKDVRINSYNPWNFTMRSRAARMQCLINGQIILDSSDSKVPAHGSVGIDFGTNKIADFRVNSIEVTSF